MTQPEPENLRADVLRAIADPGAYLDRLPGETYRGWQHRAVMAVLADHGITDEDAPGERPRLRGTGEDPPPLSRDLSGDLDAIPPNQIGDE